MENEFFFPPYVGDLYGKPDNFFNGKKVLVIGHAHYCTGKDEKGIPYYTKECGFECPVRKLPNNGEGKCPNSKDSWTDDVIDGYIKFCEGEPAQSSTALFSKFANLLGADNKRKVQIEIWKSVIFYNFAQVASPTTEGELEEDVYIKSSLYCSRLFRDLQRYKLFPDVIFVWGKFTPKHFIESVKLTCINSEKGQYEYNLHQIKIIFINHTSRIPIGGYESVRAYISSIDPNLILNT